MGEDIVYSIQKCIAGLIPGKEVTNLTEYKAAACRKGGIFTTSNSSPTARGSRVHCHVDRRRECVRCGLG